MSFGQAASARKEAYEKSPESGREIALRERLHDPFEARRGLGERVVLASERPQGGADPFERVRVARRVGADGEVNREVLRCRVVAHEVVAGDGREVGGQEAFVALGERLEEEAHRVRIGVARELGGAVERRHVRPVLRHVDFDASVFCVAEIDGEEAQLVEPGTALGEPRDRMPCPLQPEPLERSLYEIGRPFTSVRVGIEVGLEARAAVVREHGRVPEGERGQPSPGGHRPLGRKEENPPRPAGVRTTPRARSRASLRAPARLVPGHRRRASRLLPRTENGASAAHCRKQPRARRACGRRRPGTSNHREAFSRRAQSACARDRAHSRHRKPSSTSYPAPRRYSRLGDRAFQPFPPPHCCTQ